MAKVKRRRKVRRWERFFMLINTVVVVAILGTYLGRLLYWKDELDKRYYANAATSEKVLSDVLESQAVLVGDSGLFEQEDGSFLYVGDVTKNYISYSGRIYRIMKIDAEGTMTAVAQNVETSLPIYETAEFSETSLCKWLNTVYYESLDEPIVNIIETASYGGTVDDISQISNTVTDNKNTVTLLSLADYKNAGAANSYLNNGESYWLVNSNSEGKKWYVDETGSISLSSVAADMKGVRVVITFNYETTAISGDGTKDNPYILKAENEVSTIADTNLGDYITYSNTTWRVVSQENGNTALVMSDVIRDENGDAVSMSYGKTNKFTLSSGVGKYLNGEYLKSLENYESYLLENTWKSGIFTASSNYNWQDATSSSYTAYVGLPVLGDFYLSSNGNYFMPVEAYETDKLIYCIDDNSRIYSDLLEGQKNLKPVILMKGSIAITAGQGSQDNPYELEVLVNE